LKGFDFIIVISMCHFHISSTHVCQPNETEHLHHHAHSIIWMIHFHLSHHNTLMSNM